MRKEFLWFRKLAYVMVFFVALTFNTEVFAAQGSVNNVTTNTVLTLSDMNKPEIVKIVPAEIGTALTNPLMGWVVDGRNIKGSFVKQSVTMAYIEITWKDVQPKSGTSYNWETIEKKYNLEYCRQNNIKVVARIILDRPRDYAHRDIPDWLYKKIGGENGGVSYNLKEGRHQGFCPDYTNPILINEHEKLLKALSQKYVNDPVIGFIQLGSIGHYGEWYIMPEIRTTIPYPDNNLISEYVNQYREAFPNTLLLMRRPFEAIDSDRIGFYNDMFGDVKETYRWLSWINGSITQESDESYRYKEASDFWKYTPSGGELANGDPSRYINTASISDSLKMVEDSHTSWIGPCSAATLGGMYQSNIDSMMKKMGYRYVISSVMLPSSVNSGQVLNFSVDFLNKGVAPFYYNWPVEFSIVDANGSIVSRNTSNVDIRNWLPGSTYTVDGSVMVPNEIAKGTYKLNVAILDPANNNPAIQLAIAGKKADGRYELASFGVK